MLTPYRDETFGQEGNVNQQKVSLTVIDSYEVNLPVFERIRRRQNL